MDWYSQITDKDFKKNLLFEWEKLLSGNYTENHYQRFLSDNAGIFLAGSNCHLVISKLKLGSELETDFINLSDGFSNGNLYELIEIKRPNVELFTEKGTIAADFNRAIQQIRDWKRWLIDNPNWVKKHLSTVNTRIIHQSNFKFKIIIGRRITNPHDIDKRNQIAHEIGAEIRSFDYLTDRLRTREFFPNAWLQNGINYYEENLANPFFKAFTDSQWKKFCSSGHVHEFHFYSYHYEQILKMRKYSKLLKKN
ncbi:Shedu anti-phage system protein SduA domain-containing protein [Bacteroides thetaiotaomicron]|uniref:Shedu anti-phage system protein SduA domain-containing protein n=1 Tax=Bacteroides thetaiotaomicron TaxID=818 RepID=UPI00321BFDCB